MTVRFWGGHRESDWNSYWRFGELLRLKQQLEARAELWGIAEADICPAFRPPAPFVGHDFEVYVPNAATAVPKRATPLEADIFMVKRNLGKACRVTDPSQCSGGNYFA